MHAHERLSGDQLSILPDASPSQLEPVSCSGGDKLSPPKQPKPIGRQHRPKRQASGWIETRKGNQKRQKPSVSYYYRWDSPKGRVNEYVRAGRLPKVNQLIAEKRPALEILRVVIEGKKLSSVTAKLLDEPIN